MNTSTFGVLAGLVLTLTLACDSQEDTSATKSAAVVEKAAKPAEKPKPPEPAGPPLSGAAELLESLRTDFDADHGDATTKYQGREITYDGKVSMVISDDSMRVNNRGAAEPHGGPADLTCYGTVPEGLEVGADVRIKGTLTGTVGDIVGANFQVKGCTIETR